LRECRSIMQADNAPALLICTKLLSQHLPALDP
jgi:hypothetical protein